jgi:hypothetical protein
MYKLQIHCYRVARNGVGEVERKWRKLERWNIARAPGPPLQVEACWRLRSWPRRVTRRWQANSTLAATPTKLRSWKLYNLTESSTTKEILTISDLFNGCYASLNIAHPPVFQVTGFEILIVRPRKILPSRCFLIGRIKTSLTKHSVFPEEDRFVTSPAFHTGKARGIISVGVRARVHPTTLLCHVHQLLGNDSEISRYTIDVAR